MSLEFPISDEAKSFIQSAEILAEPWREKVASLTAERDQAREDCGHQRAMKESIRRELTVFINLKIAADEKIAALEAERDRLLAALAGVPVDSTEEK